MLWALKLSDAMTAPANSAAAAGAKLGAALGQVAGAADKAETAIGKVGAAAKKATKHTTSWGSALEIAARKMWDDKMGKKQSLSIDAMTRSLNNGVPKINGFARAVQFMGRTFGPRGAAATMAAGRAVSKYGDTASKVGSVLGSVALGAGELVGAISVGAVGLAVAGAIQIRHAQAFRESTLFAFEQILKSKSAAQDVFNKTAKTSLRLGADFEETMTSMNGLLAQGFDAGFADEIIRAMADLKSFNPGANLEGITRAIRQIKSTGHLQGDELMQLAEAGVNVSEVYKEIAKSMKLTAKPGKTLEDQVSKLQSKGKISSDTAIAAVMSTIKNQVGGQEFGEVAARKASGSLEGVIAMAKNLGEQLMGAIKIDWSPATNAVKSFMTALQSEKGQRMLTAMGDGISKIVDKLFGNLDGDAFGQIFDKLTEGITVGADALGNLIDLAIEAGPVLGVIAEILVTCWKISSAVTGTLAGLFRLIKSSGVSAAGVFRAALSVMTLGLSEDLIGAVSGVGALVDAIGGMNIGGTIISGIAALPDMFVSLGSEMVAGLVSGIEAGASSVVDAIVGVANSALKAAEGALGIHSPSTVFRDEIGRRMPQGMAQGIDDGSKDVAASTNSMAQRATQAGMIAGQTLVNSSSANNNRTLTIGSINVAGGAGADGGATARNIRNELSALVAQGGG